MVFRKQLLGLRYAHYYIYCLYSYLSIFMENYWFTPVRLIPSDTVEFILIFSLFIFVHLFLTVRNLTPMTLNMFTYLITPCVGTVLPLLLPPPLTLLRLQHLVLGFPPTWMSCSTYMSFRALNLPTFLCADNPFTLLRLWHFVTNHIVF